MRARRAQNRRRWRHSPGGLNVEIIVDARDMQPPEPFERTMEALDSLPAGAEVVLWIYRQPEPLFRVLERNGFAWSTGHGPEGCFEYRIRRA